MSTRVPEMPLLKQILAGVRAAGCLTQIKQLSRLQYMDKARSGR